YSCRSHTFRFYHILTAPPARSTLFPYTTLFRSDQGRQLALNTVIPFGSVGKKPVTHYVSLGYDEIYSIQYFKNNLRAWWNLSGNETIENQLTKATNEYQKVITQCEAFDKTLYANALKSGGEEYAN